VFPHLEVCYHLNGFCCQPEKVFTILEILKTGSPAKMLLLGLCNENVDLHRVFQPRILLQGVGILTLEVCRLSGCQNKAVSWKRKLVDCEPIERKSKRRHFHF